MCVHVLSYNFAASAFALCRTWSAPAALGTNDYPQAELPTQYSLPNSQLIQSPANSFWSAHYLTTVNSSQYVVISHAFVFPDGTAAIRQSLLDATSPEKYWQSAKVVSLANNAPTKNGKLSIKAPGFELSSESDDSISTMISQGSTDEYEYDLTVSATSRAILNAGTGFFAWGNGNTSQWSLPSCQTSGTLKIGDSVLKVDKERSTTWYDRQYGYGGIDSEFTWFGIQFPGSDIKASVWLSDNKVPEQHLRFATIRTSTGLQIIRYKVTVKPEDVWTSSNSGYTYTTRWFLEFDNGDFLDVKSVRDDQEIYTNETLLAVSAFATVRGKFFGQKTGFALIDVAPPASF